MIYAVTYLRDGTPVTVTGDEALHERYAMFPVVGADDAEEVVVVEEAVEEAASETIEETSPGETGDSGTEPGEEEIVVADDRPNPNGSTADWKAYRLAHGYAEAELEGLSRNALRDLADR
jgi:hypothetical protein